MYRTKRRRVRVGLTAPPPTPGTGLSLQGPDTSRGSVDTNQANSNTRWHFTSDSCPYQGGFARAVSGPIAIGWVSLLWRELTGKILHLSRKTGLFRSSGRFCRVNTGAITGGCSHEIPLSLFFAITGYLIAITGSDIAHNRPCYGAEQGAPESSNPSALRCSFQLSGRLVLTSRSRLRPAG